MSSTKYTKKHWNGEYNAKCLYCGKSAIRIDDRLAIGYRHGIEHYPLCQKHTKDYINGNIRAATAEEFSNMRHKKIIVSKDYV